MDPKAKRKQAEAVRKHLSSCVACSDFSRTRPTLWVRGEGLVLEFVHLHLLTFTPAFRVHLGLRVLNDTFPAPELNGLMSHEGWALADRKYVFTFSKTQDSVQRCAEEIAAFILEVGVPWFRRFESREALLAADSPLSETSKARLRLALGGSQDAAAIAASRTMFGLPTRT